MRIHLALCGALLAAGCSAPQSRTVNLYFVPEPSVPEIVRNCNDSARGAYRIVHHELPRDGDGQHEQARHALRGNADLIGMDVTWTAEFADAGLIAPWQDANLEAAEDDVLAGPLKTTRWDGRTYAATKNSNVQLLWYDDRVISTPPSTWDQVIAEASRLRDAGRPHRVLVTGAEYEGLVVLYNSLVASAGGQILAPDGKTVVLDDGARLALEMLHRIAGLAGPDVAEQQEEDVRKAFQSKGGAFELNWPYVHPLMVKENPADAPHFRWAPIPAVTPGRPGRGTIGGYNLGVSARDAGDQLVFDAALCLRDKRNQKYAALKDGLPPTIASIYSDDTPLASGETMASAYPMREAIAASLRDAAIRPASPDYPDVSAAIARALSPLNDLSPQTALTRLRDELG